MKCKHTVFYTTRHYILINSHIKPSHHYFHSPSSAVQLDSCKLVTSCLVTSLTCPDLVQTCPDWRKHSAVASFPAVSLAHVYMAYWSSEQEFPGDSDFDMGWTGRSLKRADVIILQEKMEAASLQVQPGLQFVCLLPGLWQGHRILLSAHLVGFH